MYSGRRLRQPSSRGPERPREEPGQKRERVLGNLVWLTAALWLSALAYLIWLLATGKLSPSFYVNPQTAKFASVDQALSSAALLFGVGLWAFALLALARWPILEGIGWLFLAIGGAIFAGSPAFLQRVAPGIDLTGLYSPARKLLSLLQAHGAGLLCLGVLRLGIGMVLRQVIRQRESGGGSTIAISESELRPPAARTLTRQCWELVACQRAMRESCPRFRQRIPCWREKSGCYCDEKIAHGILAASQATRTGVTPIQRSAVRARHSAAFLAKQVSPDKGKLRCIECALYQEHQRVKFRILAWTIYPSAALAVWLISGPLRRWWINVDVSLGRLIGNVSLLPGPVTGSGERALPVMDVSWVFVVAIAIIAISTFMKISEYLVFKRGL